MTVTSATAARRRVAIHPVDINIALLPELEAMLKLLRIRTGVDWQIELNPAAPVHITHAGSALANSVAADGAAAGAGAGAPQVLVVYDNHAPRPAVRFAAELPFRVMPMLELLQHLADILLQSDAAAAGSAAHTQPAQHSSLPLAGSAHAHPAARFAEQLAHWLADPAAPAAQTATYADGGQLVCDRAIGKFFVDPLALAHLKAGRVPISLRADQTALAYGKTGKLPRTISAPTTTGAHGVGRPRPLAELVWATGLALSSDASAAAFGAKEFLLDHWPPFGIFDNSTKHLKLAAALTFKPATIEQLARQTETDSNLVARFIAACVYGQYAKETAPNVLSGTASTAVAGVASAAGNAPAVTAPPAPAAPKDNKLKLLVRGLRSRLGL